MLVVLTSVAMSSDGLQKLVLVLLLNLSVDEAEGGECGDIGMNVRYEVLVDGDAELWG